jgi:flagellar basal-body rod protein FlgF
MGLIEIGEVMMVTSERRLELVSQNITNASTPGFKKSVNFEQAISAQSSLSQPQARVSARPDLTQGPLRQTGRPLDIALAGDGFFQLRANDGRIFYTRNGQFSRSAEGRITGVHGYSLQTADGGDLVLSSDHSEIVNDGTVLENGAPVARIGLFAPRDAADVESIGGTLFTARDDAMHEVSSPLLRQGMLESSNVDNAGEMLQMMAAMRQAEAGARVVEAYDSLLGQSISTFGRT